MQTKDLVDRVVCLSPLSKNLKGELRLEESERERCRPRNCITLETVHELRLEVHSHDCDSPAGQLLDGRLGLGQLVTKFFDGDGDNRGVHEGFFRWRAQNVLATGLMRGVTNVGTHRQPVFDPCQRCDERGVMEGMLLGRIVKAKDRRLLGCELRAAYRIRFDPSTEGGSGAVQGTLEGAIVCGCPGDSERTCIDFSAMSPGQGPNPRTEQGASFAVNDANGSPRPNTEIQAMGNFTGLDVGFSTKIELPEPCSAVEATLVHLSQPAQIEAFDSSGASVGVEVMTVGQNTPQALTISGTDITTVVVTAPQNETLLLRFCFTPSA